MPGFAITIHADNLEDAMDIYGAALSTRCQSNAQAVLSYRINNEVKILSRDNIKTGEGHAGQRPQNHRLQ
jgi:hypothetical protein